MMDSLNNNKKYYDITVLMSTYNGEKYINEQIDSILSQKGVNLNLIIRDDGSSDDTIKIINGYMEKNKNILLLKSDKNIGSCRSFFKLMSIPHNTSYIALADQDDIWDEDKLVCAIKIINCYSSDIPILYHSNLRIVDSNNRFQRNSHSFPQIPKHRYSFLVEALPTGCTIVYNRALEKIVNKIKPESFSMHDTWLYCIASLFGRVIYDFEPHINYRQHSNNTIGTSNKRISLASFNQEKKKLSNNNEPKYNNAKILYRQINPLLNEKDRKKILKLLNYKKSIINTIVLLLDYDIKPSKTYRIFRYIYLVIKHKI